MGVECSLFPSTLATEVREVLGADQWHLLGGSVKLFLAPSSLDYLIRALGGQ